MKFSSVRLGLARSLVALAVSFALILSTLILAFASPAKTEETRSQLPPQAGSPLEDPGLLPVLTGTSPGGSNAAQTQTDAFQSELQLTSASATATAAGVLLHWNTNSTADNLGFNVYRIKDGRRTRVNREIIPGALFAPGTPALMRAGYSYAWFDRGGTPDSAYFIESVSVEGSSKIHEAISPVVSKTVPGFEQTPEALSGGDASATESTDMFEKKYPAAENQLSSPQGAIQEQWAIAAQTGLKIAIKKDGWYRVTQQQMVAAGFNPTVDIRNLRLFVDANEVAIGTNQLTGPFGSGDFIEFYGRGLDTPTTDTRTYYLIAGTTSGKRVLGEIQLDSPPLDPPGPTSTPLPPVTPPVVPVSTTPKSTGPVLRDPIFFSWVERDLSFLMGSLAANPPNRHEAKEPDTSTADGRRQTAGADGRSREQNSTEVATVAVIKTVPKVETRSLPLPVLTRNNTRSLPLPVLTRNNTRSLPVLTRTAGKFRQSSGPRKKTKRKLRGQLRQERNHALTADGFAPANFDYTTEIKDRSVYFSNLLNGDAENWFGAVISSTPVTLTLTLPNPDLTAVGPATLEFALQGVLSQSGASHQVSVAFNNVTIGSLGFAPLEHPVQSFSIPIAQLQSGPNTLRFTKTSTGEVCIVDYARLTYPHAFKADSGSLKFNLRGSQTLKVDGFSTSSVRLIDYTDPLTVSITKPSSEPSASGYAVTVPRSESRSKDQRLLYAISEGQFAQPAALSLNQPSTLNLNSNTGAFLIISHKTFIPSFTANVSPINTSLVAQRQSQGMIVSIVDIDDVYDEFSYGLHGPQAIKDFLSYASTHWATPPHYVIFAGDASFDPRNYQGSGNFDFVPTKLIDATYNETSSDDWLADFDDDGIADVPVGRLPLRSVADADLVISKIVNYAPVNVPQTALLVADDPGTPPIWDFEVGNDNVQALLPASMTVQRVNVRTEPSTAQATIDIRDGLNQGRAIVNYSGHGNVNIWSGASIWGTADATALTNGNKLSFVVVMDCLNGYFQDPTLLSLSEAFVKAPGGGAVAAFASSGLTTTFGQRQMELQLYSSLYGAQPIALGDAIKIAKAASDDIDVRRTWIFFGDPSMKIR